jgi:protein-arginine kinase activator protein McsA
MINKEICKICSSKSSKIFSKKILNKYFINYYLCENCFFIQTDEPYWLNESYEGQEISALDVGIFKRNIYLLNMTNSFILNNLKFDNDFKGIDYGGGHGIFVRMARDLGFNFLLYDKFAKNLYAKYFSFDVDKDTRKTKFNVLTAFELFEHLENPMDEIKKMFKLSDTIFFSTELSNIKDLKNLEDWWYFVPESGQHISFYNIKTIEKIAKIFGAQYYSNSIDLHILTRDNELTNPFITKKETNKLKNKIVSVFRQTSNKNKNLNKSLTNSDFEYVKKIINDI